MIAVVLAWAATTKIQPGAAPVFDGPRTPRWLARASSPTLALIELAIATLVLVPATAVAGGACAVALGGIFTVYTARWNPFNATDPGTWPVGRVVRCAVRETSTCAAVRRGTVLE